MIDLEGPLAGEPREALHDRHRHVGMIMRRLIERLDEKSAVLVEIALIQWPAPVIDEDLLFSSTRNRKSHRRGRYGGVFGECPETSVVGHSKLTHYPKSPPPRS